MVGGFNLVIMGKKIIGICGSRAIALDLSLWVIENYSENEIYFVTPEDSDDPLAAYLFNYNIQTLSFEELIAKKPNIIFSINYWKKIEKVIIDSIPLGIINLHHSYKLKYKGRYSTSWAIMNARRLDCWEHGTTLHYIDEKLDEGEIIDTRKCEIDEFDTAYTLFNKVEILAIEMFKENFHKLINAKIISRIQRDETPFFYSEKSINEIFDEGKRYTLIELYDIARAWSFPDKPMPRFNINGVEITLDFNKLIS